jgi:hypothetical protein
MDRATEIEVTLEILWTHEESAAPPERESKN